MDGSTCRQAMGQPSVSSPPRWSFMPTCHCFPFLGCSISPSRSPQQFFVADGAALMLAARIFPQLQPLLC